MSACILTILCVVIGQNAQQPVTVPPTPVRLGSPAILSDLPGLPYVAQPRDPAPVIQNLGGAPKTGLTIQALQYGSPYGQIGLPSYNPVFGQSSIGLARNQPQNSTSVTQPNGTITPANCVWRADGCCFCDRLWNAYYDEFFPKKDEKNGNNGANGKQDEPVQQAIPYRRALPAPLESPPFPTSEWQGFPLIGVPVSESVYPLMKALYCGPCGDDWKDSKVKVYGWFNASGNYSTCNDSNTPACYWIVPNRMVMDQAVLRFEREVDTVQTSHCDWGFRITGDYGTDYRYFTAGGWFSDQLLVHNQLYGWDATEAYANFYVPWVAQGMIITAGRWIATPDIEVQFAPDNYIATHSLLFAIDVYTETGVMATVMLDKQWTVQAAIHAGADMAPWYQGAMPTGMFGLRWVSCDNNDSFYTVLNAINNAEFQYFDLRGTPAGHHNYNIFQSTWQHKFNDCVHTKTEAYIMWENNAPVGGTPSIGPFQFNTGGGLGPTVPGTSLTYAVLNYTMFKLSDSDFLTFRNEWTKDEHGTRYGFPGNYSSNTIGLSHNFNSVLQVRPEIGYYRSWNSDAFDNGKRSDMWLYGFDVTLRF